MSELYERDFFAWTDQQSRLLREGRAAEAQTLDPAFLLGAL